jgi:hypothetical protein
MTNGSRASIKTFHLPATEDPEDTEFDWIEKLLYWKDLNKLYNKVVSDKTSKETKILALSLCHLSSQFSLVLSENMKLRESLQAKKKHKVKGQVLPHFTNNSGV